MKRYLGRAFKPLVIIALLLFGGLSCKKKDTMTPANASKSATVNGNSVSFTVTVTSSNGLTIIQGTSSNYTLTIVLNLTGPAVFTLGAQNTNYYATVSNNLGYSYSTDAANTGQITLSRASGSNLYNGTFYFNANETSPTSGGGNISVTSGTCSNI
jgi:hypothetical protein